MTKIQKNNNNKNNQTTASAPQLKDDVLETFVIVFQPCWIYTLIFVWIIGHNADGGIAHVF